MRSARILGLALCASLGGCVSPAEPVGVLPDATPLGSELPSALARAHHTWTASGAPGLAALAKSEPLAVKDGVLVKVQLSLRSTDRKEGLGHTIAAAGGEVVTDFEEVVFAWVPASALEALAADPSVAAIQASQPETFPLDIVPTAPSAREKESDHPDARPR